MVPLNPIAFVCWFAQVGMWLVWTPRFGPLTALLLGQACLLVSMLLLSVANGLVSDPLDFDVIC